MRHLMLIFSHQSPKFYGIYLRLFQNSDYIEMVVSFNFADSLHSHKAFVTFSAAQHSEKCLNNIWQLDMCSAFEVLYHGYLLLISIETFKNLSFSFFFFRYRLVVSRLRNSEAINPLRSKKEIRGVQPSGWIFASIIYISR